MLLDPPAEGTQLTFYSMPELKELGSAKIAHVDVRLPLMVSVVKRADLFAGTCTANADTSCCTEEAECQGTQAMLARIVAPGELEDQDGPYQCLPELAGRQICCRSAAMSRSALLCWMIHPWQSAAWLTSSAC